MCGRFVLISVPIISPHCPQTALTPPSFYCATVRHKYKNTLYYPYYPHSSSYQCLSSLLSHKGIIMKRRNRHYKFPLLHIFVWNSSIVHIYMYSYLYPELISVTTVATSGGVLFQASVLFCKENAKYCPKYFGPVSVNLGYFFANLRTFLVYFLQASIVWWCTKIHKYQVCMYLRFFTGVQIVWQTLPPMECKQHLSYNRPAIHSCPCHATTAFDISANTRSYICIH